MVEIIEIEKKFGLEDYLYLQAKSSLIDLLTGRIKLQKFELSKTNVSASLLKKLTKKELVSLLLNQGEIYSVIPKENTHLSDQLFDELSLEVVGQDEAKLTLIQSIVSTINSVRPKEGPLGVYFFVGPPGVGKTEIVKALGKVLLGSKSCITKINCEHYTQDHTSRDLFGSPKSYVGYSEPTPLNDISLFRRHEESKQQGMIHPALRRFNNFAILLLDEIEKAHPSIHKSFLSIFQDGKCRFSTGREDNPKIKYSKETDFSNVIIIMTSNVGSKEVDDLENKNAIGFSIENGNTPSVKFYQKHLRDSFPPEFIDRIDNMIVFHKLSNQNLIDIVKKEIRDLNWAMGLLHGKISIEVIDETFYDYVVSNSVTKGNGARSLLRYFKETIEKDINNIIDSPVMEKAFDGGYKTIIKVYLNKGKPRYGIYFENISKEFYCNMSLSDLLINEKSDKLGLRYDVYKDIIASVVPFMTNLHLLDLNNNFKILSKEYYILIKKVVKNRIKKLKKSLLFGSEDFLLLIAEIEDFTRSLINSNLNTEQRKLIVYIICMMYNNSSKI